MAATEASATPAVQEDGKNPESKQTEAEEPAQKSETVNSQAEDKDGTLVNSEVIPTKDSVAHDAPVEAAAAESGEEEAAAVGGEAEAAHVSENHEHKTSFLDSFLNKSGLGKVMSGRKKKEASAAAGAASEESAAEGAEKDQEKTGDEPAATAAAEGAAEGGSEADKTLENGDKEDEKKCKESKSSVRDLIRKPVAKIFSHRSTEKKDGNAPEPPKQVKVRSKSLDRLEDAEALQAAADSAAAEEAAEEAAGAEAEAETDPKASSSSSSATKHMKRWHSFKKLMAQKAHKRSNAGGEDGGGGDGEGGGDSSTLDSKESGQKRWKLKRSWTFQGLKRDPSMAGISGKAKSADKEEEEEEEARDADGGADGGAEGAGEEADKADAGEEKAEASEDDKASGGASVTQHANDIWTSFKKRVIPKSKRANTECHPGGGGDEDAAAAAASGQKRFSNVECDWEPFLGSEDGAGCRRGRLTRRRRCPDVQGASLFQHEWAAFCGGARRRADSLECWRREDT